MPSDDASVFRIAVLIQCTAGDDGHQMGLALALEKEMKSKPINPLQSEIEEKRRIEKLIEDARRQGIEWAADFADAWRNQVTGTKFYFGDIIRCKFGLIGKNDMRKLNRRRKYG